MDCACGLTKRKGTNSILQARLKYFSSISLTCFTAHFEYLALLWNSWASQHEVRKTLHRIPVFVSISEHSLLWKQNLLLRKMRRLPASTAWWPRTTPFSWNRSRKVSRKQLPLKDQFQKVTPVTLEFNSAFFFFCSSSSVKEKRGGQIRFRRWKHPSEDEEGNGTICFCFFF